MYENFTQRCNIHGHNELQISGLCVNQGCQSNPQSCQACNQQFHSDHIQEVKTSNQIKEYLKEMDKQTTTILSQYEEIWTQIQTRYKQFHSEIAYQKLLIQQHLKKDIEIYSNSDLKSLSKQIKALKINRSLSNNVVNNNLKQLKLFYQFFEDTDYVYPFTFKPIKDQQLNPEQTKLIYNFQQNEKIEIYPNLDKIQEPRFKFILKVLEIENKFKLMLCSGDINNMVFQIDKNGILTDDSNKQQELGKTIAKGTIITLQFSFSGLKNSVKIEILQQNKDNIQHVHEFPVKYKLDLKLIAFSDKGNLQILHDLV
ncbi:hypothetical protein pb186bvf_007422 [Paramecium bursaria]